MLFTGSLPAKIYAATFMPDVSWGQRVLDQKGKFHYLKIILKPGG
jgi:hypothetical protein